MIDFKIKTKDVRKAVGKVQHKLKYARPLMKDLAKGEVEDAQQRIRTSKTAPDGSRWQPWAYSTIKQRARQGRLGGGLLYLTGFLHNSFVSEATNKMLKVSNKAPYAGYLQFGTDRMPARPFLGASENTKKRISSLFKKYMRKI